MARTLEFAGARRTPSGGEDHPVRILGATAALTPPYPEC